MDFATTDVDLDTDVITVVAHGLSHRHRVTFTSTGTVPNGLTAGVVYWIIRLTADTFKVADSEANAFAGTAVDITSIGSGTHTVSTAEHFVVMTDTLNPVVNDYNTSPGGIAPKFLKLGYVNSESGYVRMQALCWWDNTVHTGYGYWSGFWMSTYDSALFAYQFLGGDEYFFQASQLGATWYKMLIDNFTGFSSKLEAITKVGILQSGVTAGSSVVLQLDSGQAANFTVNKYYYLYDFQSHSWVNYCKVTAREVMSDTVTINNCNQDFPAGSVLTPYAHRYYIYGAGENQTDTNMTPSPYTGLAEEFQIPYCSHTTDQTAVFHPQNRAIYLQANCITGDPYVDVGSPDDEGFYDCIKTVIAEKISNVSYYDRTSQNRIYGKSNNVLRTARGSMGQMTNYRTLEGIDYLNISDSGQTYSYMVTYSTSAG
jgi:hypothetical protein